MKINDVTHIAVSPATRDEIVARAVDRVKRDPDNIAVAAAEVWRATGMPRREIVDLLVEHAPEMEPKHEKKIRRRAKKAVEKVRDADTRGFVRIAPDELAQREALDDKKAEIRLRRQAQREVEAEEAAQGDEPADDYADVAELIAKGVERRVPDAGGLRADGVRLAYSGAVNGLVGPPESGKTLVAIASACDTLKAGGSVLHVDSDHNGAEATISHYLAADGVEPDVLTDRARFRYVDVRSADHLRRVVAEAAEWSPSIVVVDSVGEIVPLFGGDSNSNDDYRRIHREILSPLADAGAAVLVLDHVTKEEGRGGYAIGAGAKKAAIDGSYLAVAPVEPFVPGVGGAAALTILKDRHGGLRAESPAGKSPTAAVFRLDSRSNVSTWEFHRGRSAEERDDEQAEADVEFVLGLDPFPTSRTKLQAALRAAQGKGWRDERANAALTAARARREAPKVTFDRETNERITKD
ncbi:AAA family ATPase [Microbacterium sp. 1P10AE]|uniref:AAA family ATPase n=1 Tax=Microbacterium sp. 1P10AE TaxID=3132286 RepID=UPI00399EEA9F